MIPPKSEILDRTPPSSVEAEQQVIGSILLQPSCLDAVSEAVRPDEMHAAAHGTLYAAMLGLEAERKPVTATMLLERLSTARPPSDGGWAVCIYEIIQATGSASHAVYYAGVVREKSRLRRVIEAATKTLTDAWQPGAVSTDVLDEAERQLTAIRTSNTDKGIVDAPTATMRALDRIDGIYRRRERAGRMTGLAKFDAVFGGLFPGELIILAARLGVGKTSMACQWADHNAANGRLTYFASLEMDAADLATRILCRLAEVSGNRIRNGDIRESDLTAFNIAGAELAQRLIRFDERPRLRVSDIRRQCRRLVKDGLALVVVDYLQIVTPEDRRVPREQQVAKIASDFKELARELSIPVLVLAQLNRQATGGVAPGAEHLRESDAIGQNADMVLTLTVDDKGEGNTPRYESWLRVNKNRNGPKGKMELEWEPSLTRFSQKVTPVTEMPGYETDFEPANTSF